MTITDDEREAREWLRNKADHKGHPYSDKCRTILALLDAPRMPRPDEVPDEVLDKALNELWVESPSVSDMRAAYRALYDHYTSPPQPKKVEAWAVVWPHYTAAFTDREDAEACAASGPQGAPCRIVKLVEDRDGE